MPVLGAKRESNLEELLLKISERGSSGQPLFAYQVTDSELQQLRQRLRDCFSAGNHNLVGYQAAAFCLFGAEWFRLNYRAGSWTWDTILVDGLALTGWQLRRIRQQCVRSYTAEGFNWWGLGLIVLDNGTRYLGSLICHGGLPLSVLQNDHAALSVFLRNMLDEHDRYPNRSMMTLAAEEEWRLPQTLRNEVVHEWAVKVIEAVVRLRPALADAILVDGDLITTLDNNYVSWRNQLPFAVTDDITRTLLATLLKAPALKPEPADQLCIRTSLQLPSVGDAKVTRKIEGSDTLSEQFLLNLLGSANANMLPSRFQLYLWAGDGSTEVASAKRVFGESSYRIDIKRNAILSGPVTIGHVTVGAMIGQCSVGTQHDIAGGSALPDSPWVFEDGDGKLLGIGRVRTSRPTVLIAISVEWSIQALDGRPPERLRACNELRRTIFRISGTFMVTSPDNCERFRVTTGAPTEEVAAFELRGRRVCLGPSGTEVWLGVPDCYRTDGGNASWAIVPNKQVQWRPRRGQSHWKAMDADCVGDVLLRVVEDGECLVRFIVTVMPREFSCRLRPSPIANQQNLGEIHLDSLPDETICNFCEERDVKIEMQQEMNGKRLFEIVDQRSHSGSRLIGLRLDFGDNRSAEVEISSPARSIRIIDAAGRLVQCSLDVSLPLDALHGLRQIAVIPGAQYPCLVADDGSEIARLIRFDGQDDVFYVALGTIRDQAAAWLGTLDEPGQSITFSLLKNPNGIVIDRFRIAEHAGRLESSEHNGLIRFTIPPSVLSWPFVDLLETRLTVQRLGFPEIYAPLEAITAESEQPGTWYVDRAKMTNTPWLVTAWINQRDCLHPSRIFGTQPDPIDGSGGDAAVDQFSATLAIPDRLDRRAGWKLFVDELAINSQNPAWNSLNALVETCRIQPVTTFEAVKALTQNPQAIAQWGLTFLNSRSKEIWERLERLPFLWGLVPIRIWCDALRSLKPLYMSETIWTMRQNDFLQYAAPCSSAFDVVIACLTQKELLPFNIARLQPLIPTQQQEHLNQIQSLRTQLVNRHDVPHLQWPGLRFQLPAEVFNDLHMFGLNHLDVNKWQMPVFTAPIYCAWRLVYADDLPNHDEIVRLQKLRAFDREWFSRCRRHAAFYFASKRFSQDHNWLN